METVSSSTPTTSPSPPHQYVSPSRKTELEPMEVRVPDSEIERSIETGRKRMFHEEVMNKADKEAQEMDDEEENDKEEDKEEDDRVFSRLLSLFTLQHNLHGSRQREKVKQNDRKETETKTETETESDDMDSALMLLHSLCSSNTDRVRDKDRERERAQRWVCLGLVRHIPWFLSYSLFHYLYASDENKESERESDTKKEKETERGRGLELVFMTIQFLQHLLYSLLNQKVSTAERQKETSEQEREPEREPEREKAIAIETIRVKEGERENKKRRIEAESSPSQALSISLSLSLSLSLSVHDFLKNDGLAVLVSILHTLSSSLSHSIPGERDRERDKEHEREREREREIEQRIDQIPRARTERQREGEEERQRDRERQREEMELFHHRLATDCVDVLAFLCFHCFSPSPSLSPSHSVSPSVASLSQGYRESVEGLHLKDLLSSAWSGQSLQTASHALYLSHSLSRIHSLSNSIGPSLSPPTSLSLQGVTIVSVLLSCYRHFSLSFSLSNSTLSPSHQAHSLSLCLSLANGVIQILSLLMLEVGHVLSFRTSHGVEVLLSIVRLTRLCLGRDRNRDREREKKSDTETALAVLRLLCFFLQSVHRKYKGLVRDVRQCLQIGRGLREIQREIEGQIEGQIETDRPTDDKEVNEREGESVRETIEREVCMDIQQVLSLYFESLLVSPQDHGEEEKEEGKKSVSALALEGPVSNAVLLGDEMVDGDSSHGQSHSLTVPVSHSESFSASSHRHEVETERREREAEHRLKPQPYVHGHVRHRLLSHMFPPTSHSMPAEAPTTAAASDMRNNQQQQQEVQTSGTNMFHDVVREVLFGK
jgi:hypothetical protein